MACEELGEMPELDVGALLEKHGLVDHWALSPSGWHAKQKKTREEVEFAPNAAKNRS